MTQQKNRYRTSIGDIRPSQMMFTYGVGSIIDLPKMSVIVMGLDYWPDASRRDYYTDITEDRLLAAVNYHLGHPVSSLLKPPVVANTSSSFDPLGYSARIGVPVASFPRWMVCPVCRLLAPLSSGLFKLRETPWQREKFGYSHESCTKARNPDAVPARILIACESGHLDDFPWVNFAHQGDPCDRPSLRLLEFGVSGEARDLTVKCDTCDATRSLSFAFGDENQSGITSCNARRVHLNDYDPQGCENRARAIILGSSNLWFPSVISIIAIPNVTEKLLLLITDQWVDLQHASSSADLKLYRKLGKILGELADFDDATIWEGIQTYLSKKSTQDNGHQTLDLKRPEWDVFVQHDSRVNSKDFRLRPVTIDLSWEIPQIEQVILVERMRELQAMIGFSRLDAPGELTDPDFVIEPAPISRQNAAWVPANETRGEGIFIQFNEESIHAWERNTNLNMRANDFLDAHRKWRSMRNIQNPEQGFPGMRYILLHTFSHILMRQLALECGYSAASLKERIYSQPPGGEQPAMAGLLIYTAASDSEGTLGGLVRLGETEQLQRHIFEALQNASLCAGDPLCAEREPSKHGRTVHAAACHACSFAPETSCERGNKYLDRSLVIPTINKDIEDIAFFKDIPNVR